MAKVINCECGFTVQGDTDEELVSNAQAHAKEVHGMDLTAEQALSLATPTS
jgi:predicted small metal-binding protein